MINNPNAHPLEPNEVSVVPTKALFVEMLTRDLQLGVAINDLVDNCIDGARRLRGDDSLEGLYVKIIFNAEEFRIEDNCGGIDLMHAREYAFRFGRERGKNKGAKGSVGLFGVGMKRALFKFGRLFSVSSATVSTSFSISVNVDEWENENTAWTFKMDPFSSDDHRAVEDTGTKILVQHLQEEPRTNFARESFQSEVIRLIEQSQQLYLRRGLCIECNTRTLTSVDWTLYEAHGIKPGYKVFSIPQHGKPPVNVRIYAGVTESSPAAAGWYVICNGRVIVTADQTARTGWTRTTATARVPKYHNQFARFRGYLFLDCDEPALLPWNTTKDDIDVDSVTYQSVQGHMVEMMRPVIDFLNALDAEDEDGPSKTPLHDALKKQRSVALRDVQQQRPFASPPPENGPRLAHISYSVELTRIQALAQEFSVDTYKDVGLQSFGLAYQILVERKK